jgi:hypothetical protein
VCKDYIIDEDDESNCIMQNYPNKTIFDYYHPWKVGGSIEKEIATLPKS